VGIDPAGPRVAKALLTTLPIAPKRQALARIYCNPAHCRLARSNVGVHVQFRTTDLCDQYPDEVAILEPIFKDYGGTRRFAGPVATIKCFEDNSRVRDLTAEQGLGRVLVIDAGASMRRAVLGDLLAQKAVDNGWEGCIVYGCIRDSAAIAGMQFGVKALGTVPLKTDKRGEGQRDIAVQFAGATIRPGDWLYADEDGVIVAHRALT
jgi:regulator of ribonuclease activity A